MTSGRHEIGLIADTHGLVRPDVHAALAGVELILHAGDVGPDSVLDELELIAPVRAVYGNTDAPGRPRLAESLDLVIGGVRVHVSHGHEVGSPGPSRLVARYGEIADVIVYGHTHKQLVVETEGKWVVNPGAAGPRRFDLLPSVARMTIENGGVRVRLFNLAV
jgi:putative phosphoesterase